MQPLEYTLLLSKCATWRDCMQYFMRRSLFPLRSICCHWTKLKFIDDFIVHTLNIINAQWLKNKNMSIIGLSPASADYASLRVMEFLICNNFARVVFVVVISFYDSILWHFKHLTTNTPHIQIDFQAHRIHKANWQRAPRCCPLWAPIILLANFASCILNGKLCKSQRETQYM